MKRIVFLEGELSGALGKLEDLRRKADDAMQAVARQRIAVEKVKVEIEKVKDGSGHPASYWG